tara:strand:+ start:1964 stop:2524 length:561 start_codon:yes stop_codon:yes gene_type:complete
MKNRIIPHNNSAPTGTYKAQFYSINKAKIKDFRLQYFFSFRIIDKAGKPVWNKDHADYMYAGIQANVPEKDKGNYSTCKVNRLARIMTPRQFMINGDFFPSIEDLFKKVENDYVYEIIVESKTSPSRTTFSKITHIKNPRDNQFYITDGKSRHMKKDSESSPSKDDEVDWDLINTIKEEMRNGSTS